MFSIEFSNSAKKFLKKSDKNLARRLIEKIELLIKDPFPKDVKRVINKKDKIFRIRVGDYRIQYSVLFDRNLIFITDINKRPKAY
jgi:mRNA interferase RelE/StbE